MLRPDQADMIARVAERLRALADENRIRLLLTLREGEQSVGALVAALGLNQANVSKHLAVLRNAGLIALRRQGTQSFYRIADPRVFEMCALVCDGVIRHLEAQQAALRDLQPRPATLRTKGRRS